MFGWHGGGLGPFGRRRVPAGTWHGVFLFFELGGGGGLDRVSGKPKQKAEASRFALLLFGPFFGGQPRFRLAGFTLF